MVPSSRLLLFTAFVGLPLFLMAGMDVQMAAPWTAALGALGLLVVLDLAFSLNRLEGLGVESGKIQRLIQGREGALELFVTNPSKTARKLRLGLSFPRGMETPQPDLFVQLPKDAVKSRLSWPVTPRERGRVLLEKSYLEAPSFLGFWDIRKSVPSPLEIRVYPSLSSERKNLAALFLNRGGYGVHAQRQVGKGREFDKLREYMHGDSYADIHWKATARRNHPVTKIFQVEKTQEVYVVVDASRLSARPPGEGWDGRGQNTILERFLTASLVLRVAAEKQGDLFGLVTFSDKVHGFLPAKNGRAHYNACREMLYTLYPRKVTPDFDELFTTLRLKMRRRALLFFLTNLDDPVLAEQFTKNVALISRQHLVMVNMIHPGGAKPLFDEEDPASPPEIGFEFAKDKGMEGENGPRRLRRAGPAPGTIDLYERLGGHLFWHRLKELERVLKSRGTTLSLLKNENFSAQMVTQYINLKQRQIL